MVPLEKLDFKAQEVLDLKQTKWKKDVKINNPYFAEDHIYKINHKHSTDEND